MRSRKLTTGAFLMGGLILFIVGLFLIGNRHGFLTRNFEIYTEFARVNGLQSGARVRVSGMDAGEVLEVRPPDRPDSRFRVKLRIQERLHALVRTDSVATIKTTGLAENSFIDIEKGTERAPESPEGSTIPSREPIDLAGLMQQGNDLLQTTRASIEEVRGNADRALQSVGSTAAHSDHLIVAMSANLKDIAASGRKTLDDVSGIVAQVKQGRGTVGELLAGQKLAADLDDTMSNLRQSAINLNHASSRANDTIADFQARDLLGCAQAVLENTRQITQQLNQAVNTFMASGTRGKNAAANLRQAVANAQQSMSNLADDTEALKHSFFLRGFFKRRGFFNLSQITPAQYRSTKFFNSHSSERVWLSGNELFITRPNGTEELSKAGQERIARAMSALVPYLPNSPMMVEGCAVQGSPGERFLRASQRAAEVRDYLEGRFGLNPKTIGTMPMSDSPPPNTGKTVWDGVALALIR
jgi:phospholipid/cholesterol/gamma-HCH transport system substrate-binding protein